MVRVFRHSHIGGLVALSRLGPLLPFFEFLLFQTCQLGWALLAIAVTDFRSIPISDVIALLLTVAGLATTVYLGTRIALHAGG